MTLRTGSAWARKSVALGLALLSGGCTTVVVTEPEVHLNVYVAPLPIPTYQPMGHAPYPDGPIIINGETTE